MKYYIPTILVLISLIGFVDSAYLLAQHYSEQPVVCEIGGRSFGDCNDVLTSKYATVAGIPVALGGSLYYFVVLILASLLLTANSRLLLLKLIILCTGVGFLASLWFVYLQLFVINAICIYCMVSAVSTTTLFLLGIYTLRSERKIPNIL